MLCRHGALKYSQAKGPKWQTSQPHPCAPQLQASARATSRTAGSFWLAARCIVCTPFSLPPLPLPPSPKCSTLSSAPKEELRLRAHLLLSECTRFQV